MATNLPVLHGDGKRIRYNTVHFTFAVITLYYILLHVINPNPINEFRWISQCCASVVWMSAGPEAFPLVHGRCAAPALPRCPATIECIPQQQNSTNDHEMRCNDSREPRTKKLLRQFVLQYLAVSCNASTAERQGLYCAESWAWWADTLG